MLDTNKLITDKTIILNISGMSCASCIDKTEKALNKVVGVNQVTVNLASEKAKVTYSGEINKNDLLEAINKIGFTANFEIKPEKKEQEKKLELDDLKLKLTVGVVIALILLTGMLSDLGVTFIPMWFMNPWFQMVITIPVQFWVGARFLNGAWKALKNKTSDMNTLVALGTLSAFTYSSFATIFPDFFIKNKMSPHIYFESVVIIIVLVLTGRYLESLAKAKTSQAIKKLINLQPKTAILIKDGIEKKVAVEELILGDIVLVKPGERIPVDGIIIKGSSIVDESMITGESIPIKKNIDNRVIGATINKNGSFEMKVDKIGENTMLAKIIKLIDEAQSSKVPIQKLVNKVTTYFVPTVIVISLITFIYWAFIAGNFSLGLLNAVGVLVIACPCAMGLATPTAIMVGTGKAAELGILIKNADSLEVAGNINSIVLDKTGTLTKGKPEVTDIISVNDDETNILLKAASLEKNSEHPLGEAIIFKAKEKEINLKITEYFSSLAGKGITAEIDGIEHYLGNKKLMVDQAIEISIDISKKANELSIQGKTVMYLCDEKNLLGLIAVSDTIKENALEIIQKLKQENIEITMLTGDNRQTAEAIAKSLGIKKVFAEVLPKDKSDYIKKLQQEGKIVAMVGDGINDAPALTQANLGIAMGTGTDIAIESSDITLIKGDLQTVMTAINLSKRTMKTIKQNLFWSFIYNIIGIPIAAGLLYPIWGITLNPIFAAGAMGLSSVSVISNSLRLRYAK